MPEPDDVLTEPDDVTGLRVQGADDGVLVEVRDLSVHYLGRQEWILRQVSFDQLVGKVTAVIGPSGCGKTTLVRALCGLVPHCLASEYSGSLQLAGTEIADASVQLISGHIAYVGQNPDAAVVTRTVHDDVAFPLQNLCLPRDEIASRVVEALRSVGLLDRIWDDPWTLSGGQRQRLAVAVALAMHPRLLVLDEPTSTIDPTGQRDFYTLVAGLVADGMGVVVIDHDLDPVLPIVDQVLALDADHRMRSLADTVTSWPMPGCGCREPCAPGPSLGRSRSSPTSAPPVRCAASSVVPKGGMRLRSSTPPTTGPQMRSPTSTWPA